MMERFTSHLPWVVVGLLIGTGVVAVIGETKGVSEIKQQALDRGFARYHPKTGEWEWVEQKGGE